MSFYRNVVRPILFRLSPDRSHAVGQLALRHGAPWRTVAALQRLEVDDPRLRTRFAGVDLPGPVGLAAGFDKNCDLVEALSHLGFGFLTVGSIMPEPRFGNPFPRLVRYPETQSLADAMGVPSRGLVYCVERLGRVKERKVPVFANIGGFSAETIAASFFAVEPYVDAIEISLMCPNLLQAGERFDDLGLLADVLVRIAARRKPAIIRVPNDTARSSDRLAEMIERCVAAGVEGLKVAGGRSVSEPRLGVQQGTLHGRAVFDAALENVARAAQFARGRIAIKGNGGISSAGDVIAMLRAGATCVDLYSAFIYQGWTVARDINRELAPMLGPLAAATLRSEELNRDEPGPSPMSARETIHLAADISFIHTDYLWRMPGSWVGYPYYSTSDFYEDIARIAARGMMDMLFFGDNASTSEDYGGDHRAVVRLGAKWPRHDMTPMIRLLARVASGVGFALTMSTTYHHPFHVARTFNALDHVTRGRIAWNAVTSAYKSEGANWGFDELIEHDERYVRAQEHLQVACALWDSVERDALVLDRERGVFVDPDKVHRLDFRGKYFNVRGPLPALPSPQQRPVIIQAGQSGPGMDLAAKYAEMQFSTRRTLPSMKQHRAAIDAKLAAFGRKPRDLGILWSIRIQVAESESEARAKEQRFLDSIPPEAGLIEMSQQFGVDFSTAKPGMRLIDFADQVKSQKGNLGSFEEMLKTTDPSLTVAEFGRDFMTRRILVAEGTPKTIVDRLEQLHHETGANGGFILGRGFHAMDNIREFVDLVVPELQRRGLSKTKYGGSTLRENFND